eukprot:1161776-Pelagomonas_calceolata.AAC.12
METRWLRRAMHKLKKVQMEIWRVSQGEIRLHRYIRLQGQLSGNTRAYKQTWQKSSTLFALTSRVGLIGLVEQFPTSGKDTYV